MGLKGDCLEESVLRKGEFLNTYFFLFSSWGGKRSDELAEDVPLEPDVKRAPFSSWGGKKKRGGSSFSAWGGKRNTDLMDYIKAHLAARSRRDDSPIKVIRPARAAFSAWGGK